MFEIGLIKLSLVLWFCSVRQDYLSACLFLSAYQYVFETLSSMFVFDYFIQFILKYT